jgi:hypothetical protein
MKALSICLESLHEHLASIVPGFEGWRGESALAAFSSINPEVKTNRPVSPENMGDLGGMSAADPTPTDPIRKEHPAVPPLGVFLILIPIPISIG